MKSESEAAEDGGEIKGRLERLAGWKHWAMQQAVVLRAAGAIGDHELEATAERIYRWTAFASKVDVANDRP